MSEPRNSVLLFTDLAGSTALYERLGDDRAHEVVAACLQSLTVQARAHAGRVVKEIGDSLMCAFADADAAFDAAIAMQQALSGASAPRIVRDVEASPAIRVGFHAGAAIAEAGDLFGDTVNVAARVGALAKARQILTTGPALLQLTPQRRMVTRSLGTLAIRGRLTPMPVHEVIWEDTGEATLLGGARNRPGAPRTLELTLRGAQRVLARGGAGVSIGRGTENALLLVHPRVSRQHARIEPRPEGFVLVDVSNNGTFLQGDGAEQVQVHRGEAPLHGSGLIGCGVPPAEAGADALHFRCA